MDFFSFDLAKFSSSSLCGDVARLGEYTPEYWNDKWFKTFLDMLIAHHLIHDIDISAVNTD